MQVTQCKDPLQHVPHTWTYDPGTSGSDIHYICLGHDTEETLEAHAFQGRRAVNVVDTKAEEKRREATWRESRRIQIERMELGLNDLASYVHEVAVHKGWWPDGLETEREFPELIALMHSELSEALESWRDHEDPYFRKEVKSPPTSPLTTVFKPEGWGVEMADCIIRILDACEYYGLNIANILKEKMFYNLTREQRHGNKKA